MKIAMEGADLWTRFRCEAEDKEVYEEQRCARMLPTGAKERVLLQITHWD